MSKLPFFPTILPIQELQILARNQQIYAQNPILPAQWQPASLDLRLGRRAWRVRASFLPGKNARVADGLARYAMHELDLTHGVILERGAVYLVELEESLQLSPEYFARANPKSSSGRLDIFTRLITDFGETFEDIPAGYSGRLYAEIAPRAFAVLVRQGSRLNQIRILKNNSKNNQTIENNIKIKEIKKEEIREEKVSVDLATAPIMAYKARAHTPLIDVDQVGKYAWQDFWEAIYLPENTQNSDLILDPGAFYILQTAENIAIPLDQAAEMLPYDTGMGEFRVHYAGFFDPGFGVGAAARGVLEVRSFEVPFVLRHGQAIARLVYTPLAALPAQGYGQNIRSNYQGQGLKLSKHFV